ncbi:MAG: cytochrome c [Bacteroidia bacterium]|nr:cytochrome c [Bacteroidia bacterium]
MRICGNSIIIMLLLACSLDVLAFEPWNVPGPEGGRKNPLKADKNVIENGRIFFMNTCKACHGEQGLGNGVIKAADMTTAKFQSQTDGELFYKITTGRGQMPSFKAMNSNDLWQVIIFIRTLAGGAKQVLKKNAMLNLIIDVNKPEKQVTGVVYFMDEAGQKQPLEKIKVGFYVQRMFGLLPVGSKYTNDKGYVRLDFPSGIIGDTIGNLNLVAKLEDAEYKSADALATVKWGLPNTGLKKAERTLWATNKLAPVWLILSFTLTLLVIFGVIIYVLLQVRKIHRLGKIV